MLKILEKIFLSEINHTPLSEKEDKVLDENFGLKSSDELTEAFNNTKTKEEYIKMFNRISNRDDILNKLVKTVSNSVKKELRM